MKKNKTNTEDGYVEFAQEQKKLDARSGGEELDIYEDPEEEINEYYLRISYGIRFFKFLTLTVFVVFILCMLTAFSEDITSENFQYLMKDLNIELPSSASEFGHIAYSDDAELSFAMFKNDLLSVGRQSVEIVDMAGDPVLKSDINYVKPRISAGENYFLIYDLSGYEFSVYNSFSLLYSETLEYPISDAYMADNGRFVIVTRTDDYRCCVIIYNKDYEQAYTWKTNDKYVFDIVLDDDGNFTILAATTENGAMNSVCVSGNIKSDQVQTKQYGQDVMGLLLHPFENGKGAVFCTDRILFTDSDRSVTGVYPYGLDKCTLAASNEKYALAVLDKATLGEDTVLCAFNNEGQLVHTVPIDVHPLGLYAYGECAYILYADKILKVSLNDGTVGIYECDSIVVDLLYTENGILLAAGKTRAYPIENEEFNILQEDRIK